ncbi:MarR family winged helix-turn-helix transcriptional regulator [Nocardia sp. alder85J]|uniref:MarR family winged helix-turn-helix transcriptional regulator n=1 Tax=Nocardia sp. alder85J TaxID=2862949 RepID=UPI001CD5F984|nr:MarR family transcriptional regulator [Nocardia sp. alder85J]MCX4091716.1 MarR family transcriptional regulator [Nocardia sp. alder85J]
MEKIPARLTVKPTWLLTQLAVHAHRLSSGAFATLGGRGYHYRILAALDEFGPASQADLGRHCTMDRSDVVAAINELADRGFVERTPDPADRRRNIVSLTAAGGAQLRSIERELDTVQERMLEPLPDADRAVLIDLLTRLLVHHRQG